MVADEANHQFRPGVTDSCLDRLICLLWTELNSTP